MSAVVLPPPPARSSLKKSSTASTAESSLLATSASDASISTMTTLTSNAPSTPRSAQSAPATSFPGKLRMEMLRLLPSRKGSLGSSVRSDSPSVMTQNSDNDSVTSELTPRKMLGVPTDVNDTDLKKAYRKQAIKYHPDKNPSPDAEEKFKDISKAYQILSDPNLRVVYDKNGAKMVDKEGGVGMEDAAGFFANVFGGERFKDYIGEISLMKEMTSVATTMMTDEEKTEIEREMNGGVSPASAAGAPVSPSPLSPQPEAAAEPATPAPAPQSSTSLVATPVRSPSPARTASPAPAPGTPVTATPVPETPLTATVKSPASSSSSNLKDKELHKSEKEREAQGKKRAKISPEQRKKLQELEEERRKNMEERIDTLAKKLVDRLRPFVEAKHPGLKDDPETVAFEQRMHTEADDLKLESFGVELLHTIGNIYMTKATSFLKSKKFLGIPGFFSRLREKGAMAKDAWGVIGSAIGVQQTIAEMEKLQAKGELGEEELRALEEDVTGKIMLASWRGTRFEVSQVLREVVDRVLKEHGVSDQILYNRAKGLLLIGAIFKQTVPDETDEERRELERMVAEAASGKSKHHQLRAERRAKKHESTAAPATPATPTPAPEAPAPAA
ncbi:DnaJ-like protein 1 [Trametes pubescens]|uniref:DnaJ-like protein 1 n=1 Tax=Trametes pubescens TaxID=154538 RepID=A0A1M2VGM1_TRAPU|nr:DnaJ-like protein 1 [Trametes pubescens]